jgi:hypothetical protein
MTTSQIEGSKAQMPFPNLNTDLASRDLIIKKIAFAIITLINCGIIVGVYTYLVMYDVDIPTKPLLLASFAIGVVGAFMSLKSEMFATAASSLYGDGPTIIGQLATYLFFGPTEYIYRNLDWTNYGDVMVIDAIADDFSQGTLAKVCEKYEKNLSNLQRYGFIDDKMVTSIKKVAPRVKAISKELEALKEHNNYTPESRIGKRVATLETELNDLHASWKKETQPASSAG